MKVLILGGTAEARALATALHDREGRHLVVTSLAGRVARPALPDGQVRVGGFGGAEGLADYLRAEAFDALVDATHPFAASISAHAARAAEDVGVRLVALRRPKWSARPGDRWTHVPDIDAAARCAADLPERDGCVFVTTGRRGLEAYARDQRHSYLIRSIEQPDPPLPPRHTVVLDRGPFTLEDETALLARHMVYALVTKNSGGASTEAKLVAARLRGIPVIMVDPPAPPSGVAPAGSVAEVLNLLGFVDDEPADRPLTEPHPTRLAPDTPRRAEILARHREAMEAGRPGYTDPATGYVVLTAAFLAARRRCCGNGCRHCPYVNVASASSN